MDGLIRAQSVKFSYEHTEGITQAVEDVQLRIEPGEYIVILGRNGSGKSTLAKLLNALELPDEGDIYTAGYLTSDDAHIFDLRKACGMIFQNPDNQIVGTTVEEDVAFGPENLGIPLPELQLRVDEALESVGLLDLKDRMPSQLSGGQKQKLAIAGVLAMSPQCMILDEATSMLDPLSAQSLMELVHQLVKNQGLTVINITHHMNEAIEADRVYVMDKGRLVADGTPRAVFGQVSLMKNMGLEVPFHTQIAYDMAHLLHHDEALSDLDRFCSDAVQFDSAQKQIIDMVQYASDHALSEGIKNLSKRIQLQKSLMSPQGGEAPSEEVILSIRDLSYAYEMPGSKPIQALKHISFELGRGECLGIMGHTGSGKSTLIQHLNGLIKQKHAHIQIAGYALDQPYDIKGLRSKVGMVFQYPEHQLFAETCRQDIAFGLKQQGQSESDIEAAIESAMTCVGLSMDLLNRSPFELSGGQKRRVAIAGIIAMKPDILILDEPAAGLDPEAKRQMFDFLSTFKQHGMTLIWVSHHMDELAQFADRLLVLHEGQRLAFGTPQSVFSNSELLASAGVKLPPSVVLLNALKSDLAIQNEYQMHPETVLHEILVSEQNRRGQNRMEARS